VSEAKPKPAERGFPPAEFEARTMRAQDRMAREGMAMMLLMCEPDVRYFTGFLTPFWLSPTRPWFLVVPASGKPRAVIPEIGVPLMERTWIDDICSWPSPRPADDGISLLASVMRSLGADGGKIGIPKGEETSLRMPLADLERMAAQFPGSEFVDAGGIMRRLRAVKSEAEVAKIARACRVASAAFARAPDILRPGLPLAEAFRAFRIELLRSGADEVPYLVGASSPGGYADVISPPGEDPLAEGDVLMMDTGAVWDGYYCDFDRNYAVGRAGGDVQRAHAALHEATERGLEAARPGAALCEVHEAMRRAIASAGFDCEGVARLGHGLGMQLTEWPSIMPGARTVLEPGMALTLEPCMACGPGKSMVHEENVVVRESGAELLTERAPASLPEIR